MVEVKAFPFRGGIGAVLTIPPGEPDTSRRLPCDVAHPEPHRRI
jgi:hypothetical protein